MKTNRIAVFSHPFGWDACLAYLDMLSDPDAYLVVNSGPDGEFWASDSEGNAFLTEEGLAWLEGGNASVVDFEMSTGEKIEYWNTPWIIWNGTLSSYGDGEGEKRCCYTSAWKELNEISTNNDLYHQWQDTVGYETWADWLEAAAFLEELAPRLKERDGILWRCRSHGTRGRVHLFTRL